MTVEVCLAQMPYGAVERPSIALGTLNAILKGTEIRSEVLYPNIWFAERVDLDLYSALVKVAGHTLVGEWTFAGAAFPEFTPDHDEFLRLNEPELASFSTMFSRGCPTPADTTELLWRVRRSASEFIDEAAQRILARRPRVVGCTSTFQQHCASLALLRRVRELDPAVITMLGGGNCEGPMGRRTHQAFPWVDFVVSGEADGFFLDLCRTVLRDGRQARAGDLPYGVFGPVHRDPSVEEAPRSEVPRAVVRNLDVLPVPDYVDYFEALKVSEISRYVDPGLLIETARGCWWGEKSHCTFCGLNGSGMTFRSKSPDRVVSELRTLSDAYGFRRFEAVDNIVDTRYFESVFAAPELTDGGYSLFYETKANLGRRQLQRLANAGVRWIQPGIESLHPEMVKLFRKGNTVWTSVQLLKWALEYGIRVEWLFLFGAPGEKDAWYAEMAKWMGWVAHLQAPSGMARVEYDRFSPYQSRPDEFGIHLSHYRTYDYVYPLVPAEVGELAYFFEDYVAVDRGNVDAEKAPGLATWWQEVMQWRVAWLKVDLVTDYETPQLRRRETNDGVVILDTRPCATEREFTISDAAARVLRACDEAVVRDRLPGVLEQRGDGDVVRLGLDGLCAELIARKILLEAQGRLLDLTLPEQTPKTPRRYPGGAVHPARYRRDRWLAAQAAGGGLAVDLAEPVVEWTVHAKSEQIGGTHG